MTQLRIIFAGSGEFGVPTLAALREAGHQIVSVITQPERPAGRGRGVTPTPIAQWATKTGLPVTPTDNINALPLPDADLMVVIAFGQKIARGVIEKPRLGAINLHASRLPKYRGAAPINWAILNGDGISGNSIIRLADRMDAGAVLAISKIEIGRTETAGELHDRLSQDGVPLTLQTIEELATGTAIETPQDESLATIAPKLSRKSAMLDFSKPAAIVCRTILGLYPWPGCRVSLRDVEGAEVGRMRLVRAEVAGEDAPRWEPGEITSAGTIQCGGGDTLRLLELQPDGGKPMSMADYRRGHRWQAGLRLQAVE
jgi:methionyl-tRNA formyltransferase